MIKTTQAWALSWNNRNEVLSHFLLNPKQQEEKQGTRREIYTYSNNAQVLGLLDPEFSRIFQEFSRASLLSLWNSILWTKRGKTNNLSLQSIAHIPLPAQHLPLVQTNPLGPQAHPPPPPSGSPHNHAASQSSLVYRWVPFLISLAPPSLGHVHSAKIPTPLNPRWHLPANSWTVHWSSLKLSTANVKSALHETGDNTPKPLIHSPLPDAPIYSHPKCPVISPHLFSQLMISCLTSLRSPKQSNRAATTPKPVCTHQQASICTHMLYLLPVTTENYPHPI